MPELSGMPINIVVEMRSMLGENTIMSFCLKGSSVFVVIVLPIIVLSSVTRKSFQLNSLAKDFFEIDSIFGNESIAISSTVH